MSKLSPRLPLVLLLTAPLGCSDDGSTTTTVQTTTNNLTTTVDPSVGLTTSGGTTEGPT